MNERYEFSKREIRNATQTQRVANENQSQENEIKTLKGGLKDLEEYKK